MRSGLIGVLALLLAAGAAVAQTQGQPGAVQVFEDADTGETVASTRGWTPVKQSRGYSASTQSQLVIWVEAVAAADGTKRVMLVGQKLRYVTPNESRGSQVYGPSDPTEPAFVGSPFVAADLRHRETEVTCWDDAHWCAYVWDLEIRVPQETLDAFLRNARDRELRVALDKRRQVDWRVTRAEIEAALRALDNPPADS